MAACPCLPNFLRPLGQIGSGLSTRPKPHGQLGHSNAIQAGGWHGLLASPRRNRGIAAALLATATLLLYFPVVHHDFLNFDDPDYVTANSHVRSGLNFPNLGWAFRSLEAGNWHPVTWLFHMADCQFFGLNPGAHHVVNVLLHAANVLLLFWLLQQATGALGRSFLVAALFAFHPLNIETVAWVAERKNLLSALFSLITIAAYGWYVQRPSWKRYLLVGGVFVLALMSKPMAVTIPFLLLLLDYWPLQRGVRKDGRGWYQQWGWLFFEKAPLLAMTTGSVAITVVAQRAVGAVVPVTGLSFWIRVQNAVVSYVEYIVKMLWPTRLAVYYPHLEYSLTWSQVAAAAIMLAGMTALVLRFHRRGYLVMGWLFYVLALFPVIGIIQVGGQAMADRYAYVPLVGLFIIIVWGLAELADALSVSPAARTAASLCLIAALAATSRHTLQYWQDSLTLFTRARDVAGRGNFVIENNLAAALDAAGRVDEAMEHYQAARALDPGNPVPHYNLAVHLLGTQPQAAIEEFQLAMRYAFRDAHSRQVTISCLDNIGTALMRLNDYDGAARNYTAALSLDPDDYTALVGRGEIFYEQGRFSEAVSDLHRAAGINPDPAVHWLLIESLKKQGQD